MQYFKLVIYIMSLMTAFFALSNIEWANLMRKSRKHLHSLVYVLCSIALGFLIGFFLWEMITLIEGFWQK